MVKWTGMALEGLGRVLILVGVAMAALGRMLALGPRLPFLGKLPGDILLRQGRVTFYLPLATMLLLSLPLTLALNLLARLGR